MTKGQRAMIAAKICKLNLQTTRDAGKAVKISHTYIANASIVLEYAEDLADSVVAGIRSSPIF
jgi:hypothetical protein